MKKGAEIPSFKSKQIDQLHDLLTAVESEKLRKEDINKIERWELMADIMDKAKLTPENLVESETLDQKRLDWWKEMTVKFGKK